MEGKDWKVGRMEGWKIRPPSFHSSILPSLHVKSVNYFLKHAENIMVFADDVRNLDKYSNILKRVGLIFSYGIFVYLDKSDLERVCQIIEDNFKGIVVYSDAACALDIENLQDSVEVRINHYVHPYLKVFAAHNIEQIKFEYAENKNSFVFVGVQK
jgi:hypothetical protein